MRHKVQDFEAWKESYDAFDAERKTMVVIGDGVFQAIDDPNDWTMYHDFNNEDVAKTFSAGSRLNEVMAEAGVTRHPTIWFANRV